MSQAPRLVARRDSATTILRKLGINSRDYNLFIRADKDGFVVDVDLAKKHLAKVAEQMAPRAQDNTTPRDPSDESKPTKAGKLPKAPKAVQKKVKEATRPRDQSLSATIRGLILKGLDNAAIWAQVQPAFNLDDKKRHYPAWYRAQMRRDGQLPKAN